MIVCDYFLYFMLYSTVGWIYETIMLSISQKRFVNRGFLIGPYCPIYGSGAVLCLILLGWIDNIVALFFAAMVVTGVLEYVTSYVMEKMFNARWWDYSHWKFNINGRICLGGILVFALMVVIVLNFIQPPVADMIGFMPEALRAALAMLFAMLIAADYAITILQFKDFTVKVMNLEVYINEKLDESAALWDRKKAEFSDSEVYSQVKQKMDGIKTNWQERRMISSFPTLKSVRNEDAFKLLIDNIKSKGRKKDKSKSEEEDVKRQEP